MKIALDAMGGDKAPEVNIEGAVAAAKEFKYEIILVGDKDVIGKGLSGHSYDSKLITIKHCSEVIKMDESPAQACRQKKDSSLMVAAKMVAEKEADVMISAGNSGAAMGSALMRMKRLPGVSRPAIATLMPTINGACIVLDAGANVNCKPKHLAQFAVMGNILAEAVLRKEKPTVGLLSIGEEEGKGDEATVEAYKIIKGTGLNFVGNIEGGDIPRGKADVVVCDGFVGNVVLKLSEGLAAAVVYLLKTEIRKSLLMKLGALLVKAAFRKLKKKIDYAEYGGAPLLGVNGGCIICHGSSSSKAIKNAIRVAGDFVEKGINTRIVRELKELGMTENDEKVMTDA